jgi:hypothetical protein
MEVLLTCTNLKSLSPWWYALASYGIEETPEVMIADLNVCMIPNAYDCLLTWICYDFKLRLLEFVSFGMLSRLHIISVLDVA